MAKSIRARLPAPLRERLRVAGFRRRWGFDPPPAWADMTGYDVLLEEIERHRLDQTDGDVLEIGAFLGGGTAKLCGWFSLRAADKRVIAVDVFDPEFDPTTTVAGWEMATLYGNALRGRDQRATFDEVTSGCRNLTVMAGDSSHVELPIQRLAFAFVDGDHSSDGVRSDFERVWERLSPGGLAVFHDYGGDLPAVTHTLHRAIGERAEEIARVWTRSGQLLFLLKETG